MAQYEIDGAIVSTEKAQQQWAESLGWDGHNHISLATGSQWTHETLYLSAKGRFWIEFTSQWQGSRPSARFVSEQEAAVWLLKMGHELPPELAQYESEVSE